MTDQYAHILGPLKQREGGAKFTNRKADRGGPTRWGVTAETLGKWRKLGRPATAAEVQVLTEAEADAIYLDEFIVRPGFDKVAAVSLRVAEELIDSGVNIGPKRPSEWFQRALNLCNRRGRDYPDIDVDGAIGKGSVGALKALIDKRGQRAAEDLILKNLEGFQHAHYVRITEAGGPNSDQEENFCGWVAQRIGLAA